MQLSAKCCSAGGLYRNSGKKGGALPQPLFIPTHTGYNLRETTIDVGYFARDAGS